MVSSRLLESVDDAAAGEVVRGHLDEDPVTGSTHCILAPYWAERLGKAELSAYQCSARGGELHCRLQGERVKIAGQAVLVASGKLFL